ncbi:45282_t:CDS:2, partial [Gigaspora margarita]
MTTSSASSNTITQSQERYEAAENKIIELQEKFNEQKKLNEQSLLIN